MEKLFVVNQDGEIIDDAIVITKEQQLCEMKNHEKRKQYFERQKKKDQFVTDYTKVFGSFYFLNYANLLDVIAGDTSLSFKYLYLCTFADDDGKLTYKGNPVIHKNFKNILNMDKTKANMYVNQMVEYGLLYKQNDSYYANMDYYIRNKKLPDQFKGVSCRMIDNGIKQLYEQATPRKHSMLGKIVPLLEYINKYSNVICTKDTVYEYNYKKIKTLTGVDICSICGMSVQNSDVFLKKLKSFTVDGRPFVRRVIDDEFECYIVNPYVLYMGYDLEWTFKLFDLKAR